MSRIICADWGTSVLRLRLVDTEGERILQSESSDQGIALTYNSWSSSGEGRLAFYMRILSAAAAGLTPTPLPIVLSGMASSNIGIKQLPYVALPIHADGSDVYAEWLDSVLLISGVKSPGNAMRGEETQLAGCSPVTGSHLFIFPGTHSKHIYVSGPMVTRFTTYMTGEFFTLLSRYSMLSNSVAPATAFLAAPFAEGVRAAQLSGLLESAFAVRTNHLFGKFTPEENYYFLSGLLIGSELKDLVGALLPLTIVGDVEQLQRYREACTVLRLDGVGFLDGAEAAVRGQCRIYRCYAK